MRRAALLLAVVSLTACGGHKGPTERDQVSAYIARVNRVETQMRTPLLQVLGAFVSFSNRRQPAATLAEVTRAEQTLKRLRAGLARTAPPPKARRLHRDLLEIVDRQIALAHELRQLTVFGPRFASALKPLAAANAQAQAALAGSHPAKQVTATITAYRAVVHSTIARARRLTPPAVERPIYDAQVARLVALDRGLGDLLDAVARHDSAGIARAEHAISVATVSTDTTARQKAQRAAVQSFDARVRAVNALARKIAVERNRLQTTLK